ncbi:MAG: iron transporter [Bacteroidetes bacterium RIFCSPHIGHO2_02_FULL_44_7]|nr:MAG: iron transporter [Bacteroidetes bacterium RIFCSPHIGHO2_02_FULL_44_7]
MDQQRLSRFLKTMGPGILFASTAIGVSHLVQSTRAGADYGFVLVPFILAANLFKYPFFEYGSRYANATGESLIDGYQRIGKWMLWVYFLITIGSMFFVTAAVGAVTSGFLQNLFGLTGLGVWPTVILFAGCTLILLGGRYGFLDSMIKIISAVLVLSTLLAFVLALFKGARSPEHDFVPPELWSERSILFIIALMGWMPTAVDLSAWNSLWTVARIRQTGYRPTLKETLLDFNIGYWVSAILALCFVTMGAFILYGSGNSLPSNPGEFANTVVGMFSGFIGDWSYLIIAAAAFSIMFGTCIAVFDGYSRALERTSELLFMKFAPGEVDEEKSKRIYSWSLVLVAFGSFGIVYFFAKHLLNLVDLATSISFLIAPVIAIVNYRLVTGKHVPQEAQPKTGLRILSWMGILFLAGFSLCYLWFRFMTK